MIRAANTLPVIAALLAGVFAVDQARAQNQLPNGLTARGAMSASDVIPCQPNGANVEGCYASDVQNFVLTSVKAFGAKGDGVTDDTSAIQAALNSGQPIYFPCLTYKISANLTFTSNSSHGEIIRGCGSGAPGPNGTSLGAIAKIQPTSAVTKVFDIDGSGFSGFVLGVRISDLAIDGANLASGSDGYYFGQAYDTVLHNVRMLNAHPASGINSYYFGPGSYVTKCDSCYGGVARWAGDGVDNPTTTTFINSDLEGVIANQASSITLVGGAVQPPYVLGVTAVWIASGSALAPPAIGGGVYLYLPIQLTNVVGFSAYSTDFENGGGYPSAYNDGTHGSANAYPAFGNMSTAKATLLDNPGFAGMYLYDGSGSLIYHNANIGGGAAGELFNIPTFFTQRVAASNGACLNLFSDFQSTQTGSICGSGAGQLASLLVKPLVDGGALTVKTSAGLSLLYEDTNAGLLSLDQGNAIAGFADNGETVNWALSTASGAGVLNLYNASGAGTITLTGANGSANLSNALFPGTPGGAFQYTMGLLGGAGAPSGSCSGGDVYLRSDGTLGARTIVYHCESGAWVADATGLGTFLASPPAIGGTTPGTGKFTTVTATSGVVSPAYAAGATAGVTCSGTPSASFASTDGIVTHC
jgi:hypothetical protein